MRLGVDLGGTKIEGIVLDAENRTVAKQRWSTPAGDYQEILRTLSMVIQTLEQAVGEVCSIGIGMPGAISPHSGLIKNANTVVLNGKNLPRDLGALLGRQIFVANDANCLALSEAVDGAGKGLGSVFAVIIGTGTGGGLVVNGRPLIGNNAIAGEWGHNPLPWPEDADLAAPCYCGKVGCIETYLCGAGLSRLYAEMGGENISAEQIGERWNCGEPIAAQVIGRYAQRLGRALSSVINIVDPDIVVLGGGLSKIKNLPQLIESVLPSFVFSDHVATKVVLAAHGDSSGVRGAAWLPPEESRGSPVSLGD